MSKLRQVRSPAFGSPETSSTRSLSRTPSIVTTARLLTVVSSSFSGAASISTMFAPPCGIGISACCGVPTATVRVSMTSPSRRTVTWAVCLVGTLILDAVGDGLRLADDAEARRGDERDAAVALVLAAGDERVNGRGEAERAGVGGYVVDAPIGDHDGAGDAIGGTSASAEPSAVNNRVPSVSPSDCPASTTRTSSPGMRLRRSTIAARACFGLPRAVAEILARAFVDHDDGDRAERVAILARERRIGEREHDERQRQRADDGAAAARYQEQQRQNESRSNGGPQNLGGDERERTRHRDSSSSPTAPAVRAAPARAPGPPCSCR